jgi:hypothetical protein
MNRIKTLAAILGFFILPIAGYAAYGGITWGLDNSTDPKKISININGTWYEFAYFANGSFVSVSETTDVTNGFTAAQKADIATGTPVLDVASAIQTAIGSGNKKVVFPCGTYLVASAITLPSKTEIAGAGPCTIIKESASMAQNSSWSDFSSAPYPKNIFANADWAAGNTNIYLHDITLDGTAGPNNTHLASFYRSSDIVVERVRFIGDGSTDIQDGVSFPFSSNYKVLHNYCYNIANACYDQWRGSHDFVIADNIADGNGILDYPILVNGLNSSVPDTVTYNGTITGNVIINAKSFGINTTGLYDVTGTVRGIVKNITITGNVIRGVTDFYGIRVGDSANVVVSGNVIENTGRDCIRIGAQIGHTSSTSNTTVSNNICKNANTVASATVDAITVANAADHTSLLNNTVSGTAQRWSVSIESGTEYTTLLVGPMEAGTSGLINDAGTRTSKFATNDETSSTAFKPDFKQTNTTADANGSRIYLKKSRTSAAVNVSDQLGLIMFQGHDGSSYQNSGYITAIVDSVGAGAVPAHIRLAPNGVNAFEAYQDYVSTPLTGEATSISTGALRSAGGLGVTKNAYIGGLADAVSGFQTAPIAVGSLPTCDATRAGRRRYVNDSNAALTAGIGAVVAAGGANVVPVGCDGTNWRIGG